MSLGDDSGIGEVVGGFKGLVREPEDKRRQKSFVTPQDQALMSPW